MSKDSPPERPDWVQRHEVNHRVAAEHYDELLTIGVVDGAVLVRYTGSDNGAYMMTGPLLGHPYARIHDMHGAQDFTLTIKVDGEMPGFDEEEGEEV